VIVTGGGSGLGRCTVHELASLGARVALIGRQAAKLEAVADEIATLYPERAADVSRHVCDIRIEDGVQRTVAEVLERHGRIDGLYNCAGGQYPAALRDISLKGWDAVVRNNLHGTFLFSREVYRQWMEGTAGRSSTCWPTSGAGCPGWATRALRAAGC
jgi:citronellol/citronellal dehydrogenase